jgi:hypothetical protein
MAKMEKLTRRIELRQRADCQNGDDGKYRPRSFHRLMARLHPLASGQRFDRVERLGRGASPSVKEVKNLSCCSELHHNSGC